MICDGIPVRMDGHSWFLGCTVPWLYSSTVQFYSSMVMVLQFHGSTHGSQVHGSSYSSTGSPWFYSSTVLGSTVPWFLGSMVLQFYSS